MKFVEHNLTEFTNATFSKSPTPGGGGVSALASSLGASLGGMVLNLTFGKKKYAEYEEEHLLIIKELEELKDDFLELVDKDSDSFIPLAAAYKMPTETQEQRDEKHRVLQEATKNACQTPVEIVKKSHRAIHLLDKLLGKTAVLAVSDIAVGMILLRAGLVGGWMNVLTNLSSIDDEEYKEDIRSSLERLIYDGTKVCDRVCANVEVVLENEI